MPCSLPALRVLFYLLVSRYNCLQMSASTPATRHFDIKVIPRKMKASATMPEQVINLDKPPSMHWGHDLFVFQSTYLPWHSRILLFLWEITVLTSSWFCGRPGDYEIFLLPFPRSVHSQGLHACMLRSVTLAALDKLVQVPKYLHARKLISVGQEW